jgi:hypothetical protein
MHKYSLYFTFPVRFSGKNLVLNALKPYLYAKIKKGSFASVKRLVSRHGSGEVSRHGSDGASPLPEEGDLGEG